MLYTVCKVFKEWAVHSFDGEKKNLTVFHSPGRGLLLSVKGLESEKGARNVD